MKTTLNQLKKSYSKAKKNSTKRRIVNSAMLNLSNNDWQTFIKWQNEFINNNNLK